MSNINNILIYSYFLIWLYYISLFNCKSYLNMLIFINKVNLTLYRYIDDSNRINIIKSEF